MYKQNQTGVGQRISAARKKLGMTQEELANLLHVTRQTISNYESMRSQPDIQTLIQLADCLNVPVEELIYAPGMRKRSGWGDGMANFCKNLGILIYVAGALYGVWLGSGAVTVGENQVAYGFALWDAIPIWVSALIHGTILLALGNLLYLWQRGIDGANGQEH